MRDRASLAARSPPGGVPHVEEVEPLGRMRPHDAFEQADPLARRLRLPTPLHGHGWREANGVAVVGIEETEGRHDRHTGRPRQDERSERKWCGPPEERDEQIAL